MTYRKDEHQAFQTPEGESQDIGKTKHDVISFINESDYGTELSHLDSEINEAYHQIDKALSEASEHQAIQLRDYKAKINKIKSLINN